jgi:murein L,D-transpeptidase YafK
MRSLLASAAIVMAIAIAGCQTDGVVLPSSGKAMAPLPSALVAEMDKKNMDKDSPILVRVFKEESELEIWKQDRTGQFALLKTYPICRWSGELGPKVKEGDRQAPEGFYKITPGQMNPNSAYYLSFDLGYPNAFDRAHGRTGSNLMVHGDCSSRGCYSMTDEQIAEIYALGREAFFGGQKSFEVQAYPFRMTPENFAKHRASPHLAFWKMLKQGNDHFEASRREVKVDVCEKRYVFDAQSPGDPTKPLSFSAAAKCPVFEVPEDIVAAVQEKSRKDEIRMAELSRSTPLAPIKTNADGGMHPVFAAALKRSEPGAGVAAQPAQAFSLASVPGTIPAHVNPPRNAEFADTPYATGTAAVATPAVATRPASPRSNTVVRATSPEPGAVEQEVAAASTTSSSSGNLFGSLFGGSKTATASPARSSDGPMDKMAKLIGLRSSEPAPAPAPVEPAKPRVTASAKPSTSNNGAIRPKPVEAPTRTAEAPAPTPPANPAPAYAPAPATAAAAPTATMAGSAPTVPVGSFESRWSSFR